jgi:hypothetical protein
MTVAEGTLCLCPGEGLAMANAANKTQATDMAVADFIASLPDAGRREESLAIDAMMRRVTAEEPRMWGPSIIGYGRYHYRYDSGREGDMCRIGFSPRKAQLVVYLVGQFAEHQAAADTLFAALGQHSLGKACLYIKKLADVDLAALEGLVMLNQHVMNSRYPQ